MQSEFQDLEVQWHDKPDGRVTTAVFRDSDGRPVASSFAGWLQPYQVAQRLKNYRERWAEDPGNPDNRKLH